MGSMRGKNGWPSECRGSGWVKNVRKMDEIENVEKSRWFVDKEFCLQVSGVQLRHKREG